MKKLLAVLLIISMSVSMLVGCGGTDKDTNKEPNTENSSNMSQNTENDEIKDDQIKDDVTEDSSNESNNSENVENDEFDENIYSAMIEAITSGGKVVKIYYNPQVVKKWDIYDNVLLYAHDMNGDLYEFNVGDYVSAEEYINVFIQDNTHLNLKITGKEEIKLGGHAIHSYYLQGDRRTHGIGVIELASDVVVHFEHKRVNFEGQDFENVIGAIKFVVEE